MPASTQRLHYFGAIDQFSTPLLISESLAFHLVWHLVTQEEIWNWRGRDSVSRPKTIESGSHRAVGHPIHFLSGAYILRLSGSGRGRNGYEQRNAGRYTKGENKRLKINGKPTIEAGEKKEGSVANPCSIVNVVCLLKETERTTSTYNIFL
jgi:hypothetical protein